MFKFLIVAAGSASSGLLIIIFLTSVIGIFYAYSVLITLQLFVFVNFYIHEKWTFADVPKSSRKISRFLKFNSVALIAIGINEAILISLTDLVGIHYIISEIFAMGGTFFFNFTIGKKLIWNK